MKAADRPFTLKPPKVPAHKKPFDRVGSLAFARAALSRPVAEPHIKRVEPVGRVLYEFVLPLHVLEAQNRKRGATAGILATVTKRCFKLLREQFGKRRAHAPLPGRPQICCVRFTVREPDAFADTFKVAVDRLTVYKPRKVNLGRGRYRMSDDTNLGIIVDDRPRDADVNQWWEPAPQGKGFGYIRICSGAP